MNKAAKSITSLPQTTIRFLKEARDELKKVSWPNRETTIRYTVIVIVSSVAVGLLIGGLDYAFTTFLERFLL